jgi:hypothetical protein
MTLAADPAQIPESARYVLDELRSHFEGPNFEISELPNGLTIDGGLGPTTIEITLPEHAPESEGDLAATVTIMTPLSIGLEELGVEGLAAFNKYATFSAIIADEDGALTSSSRVGIYQGHEAALDHLLPLMTAAVSLQAFQISRTFSQFAEEPSTTVLPEGDDPSPWQGDVFESVIEEFAKLGFFGTASEDGLTVEISWDGTPLAMASNGQRTSLIQVRNERHPFWGNGLFCKLEMPWQPAPEDLAAICNDLNAAELETDGPPMLGAWCPGQAGGPAFVGFVPNFVGHPAVPVLAANWFAWRSGWAKSVLE